MPTSSRTPEPPDSKNTACKSPCIAPQPIENILYALAIGAIFFAAAWMRYALPQTPIAVPDTWGYLKPALSKITGGAFEHTFGRTYPYPVFVYSILASARDFRWIPIVQHALGLATGALVFLTVENIWRFAPCWNLPRRFFRLAALAAAAFFLASPVPIFFEQQILPESVIPFFCMLNIYFGIRFIRDRFVLRKTSALAIGICTVASGTFLQVLKPSFGLATLLTVIPLAVSLFEKSAPRLHRIALVTLGLICALSIRVPEKMLAQRDPDAPLYLPSLLFAIHARMILDQIADDVRVNAALPYDKKWLASVRASLIEEIKKANIYPQCRSLGYNPDYLIFQSPLNDELAAHFGGDPHKRAEFYLFCYKRVWLKQPVRMLRKIFQQTAVFYSPKCPVFKTHAMDLATAYRNTAGESASFSNYPAFAKFPAAQAWRERVISLQSLRKTIAPPDWTRPFSSFFSRGYSPLLFATLACALAVFLNVTLRQTHSFFAIAALFLFGYNFTNTLAIAIAHTLDVERYLVTQMVFTVLSECVAAVFILEFALALRRMKSPARNQPSPHSAPP